MYAQVTQVKNLTNWLSRYFLLAAFANYITRSSCLRDRPWKGRGMEEKGEGIVERGKRILSRFPFALLSPSPPPLSYAEQAIDLPVLDKLVKWCKT